MSILRYLFHLSHSLISFRSYIFDDTDMFVLKLELTFRTGDILTVSGDMDEDGFFMGELNNQRGLVPGNFIRELQPDQHYESKSTSSTSKSTENMSGSRKSLSSSTNSLPDKREQVRSVLPSWARKEFPHIDINDIPEWARDELPPGAAKAAMVEVRELLKVKGTQQKTDSSNTSAFEKPKQARSKAAKSRK